jgi:nickel superoxide dismutase
MNKEHHANELQEIVTQYFMAQRIKIDTKDYAKKLTLLHKILVYAMKCKQTTDLSHIGTLNQLLVDFHELYFGLTQK